LEGRVKQFQEGTDRTALEILTNEMKALKKPEQPGGARIRLGALPTRPKLMEFETALLKRSEEQARRGMGVTS
jgi:hypothetical protein